MVILILCVGVFDRIIIPPVFSLFYNLGSVHWPSIRFSVIRLLRFLYFMSLDLLLIDSLIGFWEGLKRRADKWSGWIRFWMSFAPRAKNPNGAVRNIIFSWLAPEQGSFLFWYRNIYRVYIFIFSIHTPFLIIYQFEPVFMAFVMVVNLK